MKTRILLATMVFICSAIGAMSQAIDLPKPALSDTATLKYALENRRSTRNFYTHRQLNLQEISNILWSGWGYNRKDKRTAPSALDRQEITLYVCSTQGVFRYDAVNNRLEKISTNNIMPICGKQEFVENAAVNIFYVCDNNSDNRPEMSAICCGAISQNIALYCASRNIGNVVRGSFDADVLRKQLKLPVGSYILLAQSIGYPAE